NTHLPYGTDIYESDFFAEASAKIAWDRGAKIIVLPTIPYGVNTGQTDILLDINMNPSTQSAILRDILTVLNRQGIERFLILNSHGGNNFTPLLRELGLEFPKMFLSTCDWFKALDKSAYFTHPGDHADEMETSLMLHLIQELVLPLEKAGDGNAKKFAIDAFNQPWASSERKWSGVTADTGIGNPKEATAEKGKRFFNDITRLLGNFMYDIAMQKGSWYI
ncbi:MAG: creatininase family protein, partial [Spirochaetia bacterium]|nr:creatininase family protein [Spirochaetia bacterium]